MTGVLQCRTLNAERVSERLELFVRRAVPTILPARDLETLRAHGHGQFVLGQSRRCPGRLDALTERHRLSGDLIRHDLTSITTRRMARQVVSNRAQGTSAAQRRRFERMAAEYLERMGARIRACREALGLSRADVAREMPGKTNENAVYRWENGLHRPQDDTLEALATVLRCDVAAFFLDDAPPDALPSGADDQDDRLGRLERKLDVIVEILTEGGRITEHATIPDSSSKRFAETVRREAQNTRARQQAEAEDRGDEDAAGEAS